MYYSINNTIYIYVYIFILHPICALTTIMTGKAYYKVEGGQKRMVPNWDTFTSLKIPASEVLHMEAFTDFIPTGVPLPAVP